MGLTRFEMQREATARRTADALERIAGSLERLVPAVERLTPAPGPVCPDCGTAADEDGYCPAPGCSRQGKAVGS